MGTSSVTRGLARHRHNQESSAKSASDKAAKPEMPGGGSHSDHDHGGEAGGHEEIQKVHAEHGPAHSVEVKKEGEHHTVTTSHEDGHTHTSKGHPSVEHVASHIQASTGAGGEGEQNAGDMEEDGAESLAAMGLGGHADA